MWPDNDTDLDFLNFSGVATTVAEIIVQASGRPISIGISGSWGVGKSSMIKLVRRSLNQRHGQAKERTFLFVDFNAWLYQGYDDARAALLDVIAHALAAQAQNDSTAVDKAQELLKRVNWLRAIKLTAGSAAALALGLPPIGLIGEIFQLGKQVASGDIDTGTIERAERTAADVGSTASELLKPRQEPSPPKEIHAIRKAFEDTLRELKVTLVVLIDDLDRCLPETTISTLEAIRLFLFLENTAFVIAADTEMIRHAVKRHFEGVEDENLVTSYFDKLIQIPIRVPPLGTQEVRAYLMLLFVENSTIVGEDREMFRSKVCEQLGQSWQGKRVDRAFMQSLGVSIPTELVDRFDTADRLAPMMTTSTRIAGNPRLIKRFLNALSIRMAIAKANGIAVDEAVLAKMLLFERCGPPQAYSELVSRISAEPGGEPRFLHEWEEACITGTEIELPAPWNDEFVKEWLSISPRLSEIDLRGALYVSREHAPLVTPEDRLSSEGAELLAALLAHPDMAKDLQDRLKAIPRPEMTILLDRLLERARREQQWGTPPILEACLAITRADPSQGIRLAAFLDTRPLNQVTAAIVQKIGGEPWAKQVFSKWEKASVSKPVKQAIKQATDGNVSI